MPFGLSGKSSLYAGKVFKYKKACDVVCDPFKHKNRVLPIEECMDKGLTLREKIPCCAWNVTQASCGVNPEVIPEESCIVKEAYKFGARGVNNKTIQKIR